MKILLIDDDAFLRDMYVAKFSESGHEVEAVDSAHAALSKVEQGEEFDVVLLDMVMPGMTGVELIQKLNTDYPEFSAKCIVLSNQGQEEDVSRAKEAGAAGYIIKAESIPSEVVKKVESIIKKK